MESQKKQPKQEPQRLPQEFSIPLIRALTRKTNQHLKHLSLPSLKLESINFLFWIDLPNVTAIDLEYNMISSIKDLRRLRMPCLKALWLSHNPIIEAQSLQHTKLQTPWLDLKLQHTKIHSLNWLFKTEPITQSYILVPPSVARDGYIKSRISVKIQEGRVQVKEVEELLERKRFANIILIAREEDQRKNAVFSKRLFFGIR